MALAKFTQNQSTVTADAASQFTHKQRVFIRPLYLRSEPMFD